MLGSRENHKQYSEGGLKMNLDLFLEFISDSMTDINQDIKKLYSDKGSKRQILDHLSNEVMMLGNYIQYFSHSHQLKIQEPQNPDSVVLMPYAQPVVNSTKTFTLEELKKYNGKDGNPAFVAVNGVVYDVTNVAAWAAATHFGLSAGNDLTSQFASCHAGADILSALPKAGNLIG